MFGELQPLASEETPYFYSAIATQSKELSYIGHLRGDFGTDDDQFWMSWSDHAGERRTLAFRQELAALVQHLQWQGLLLNLNEMRAYCRRHPEARIPGAWHSDVCGFCLQTTHYRYYIRCFPHLGDYSFYIYCYRKNHLLGRSVQQNQNGTVSRVKSSGKMSSP